MLLQHRAFEELRGLDFGLPRQKLGEMLAQRCVVAADLFQADCALVRVGFSSSSSSGLSANHRSRSIKAI